MAQNNRVQFLPDIQSILAYVLILRVEFEISEPIALSTCTDIVHYSSNDNESPGTT